MRRERRNIRRREIVSICSKCMQVFVTDTFLRRAAGGERRRRMTKNIYGMSSRVSCLCNASTGILCLMNIELWYHCLYKQRCQRSETFSAPTSTPSPTTPPSEDHSQKTAILAVRELAIVTFMPTLQLFNFFIFYILFISLFLLIFCYFYILLYFLFYYIFYFLFLF